MTLERRQALLLDLIAELLPLLLVIANAPTEKRCSDARTKLGTLRTLLEMIEGNLRSGGSRGA